MDEEMVLWRIKHKPSLIDGKCIHFKLSEIKAAFNSTMKLLNTSKDTRYG